MYCGKGGEVEIGALHLDFMFVNIKRYKSGSG